MKTIMIVDDNELTRLMLKDILNASGFNVVAEAANGVEAVEYYRSLQPDVVTMDITMPEMNGIDALIEIIRCYSQAKVIMCSAIGQQNMVLEAIQLGAKDYIVKPFQMQRVIEAIHNTLRR